jgi:hypothetical protein
MFVVFLTTLPESYEGLVIFMNAHQTLSLDMVIGFLLQEEIWRKTIGTSPIDKSIALFLGGNKCFNQKKKCKDNLVFGWYH